MDDRDILEYDFVIVGAGPAGLACAIRLKQLKPEASICLLEKASEIGAHALSGAVLEPDALEAFLPGWQSAYSGICVPAGRDEFVMLTPGRSFRLPTPPQMHNRGNLIVSQGDLCRWLGQQAESLEVDVFPGFAGAEALFDGSDRVIGVRSGDMGVSRSGKEGPNYTPGVDIHAATTVVAEGCRGSMSKQLINRYGLDKNCSPQTYGLGFKELWQLPPGRVQPGLVKHTVGWPLDNRTYGGSFIYHLDQDRLYIGFVVGLDYEDPRFSPFEAFQQFKHHPTIRPLLEGGEIISAGARALIEGGYQSMPKLDMPGALLAGDAAGTLNVPKIKGIHMAVRCGTEAAEHLVETGSSNDFDARWRNSQSGRELYRVRNIRPGFKHGLWVGLANAALETATMGRLPWTLGNHADWSTLEKLDDAARPNRHWTDRDLPPRDCVSSVYFASLAHEEDQPVHLKVADTSICATRCAEEYGNPCTLFCPVNVYEMIDDGDGGRRLQINAANCVHCKACDIKDPYGIINWVTPEGGSGPNYLNL